MASLARPIPLPRPWPSVRLIYVSLLKFLVDITGTFLMTSALGTSGGRGRPGAGLLGGWPGSPRGGVVRWAFLGCRARGLVTSPTLHLYVCSCSLQCSGRLFLLGCCRVRGDCVNQEAQDHAVACAFFTGLLVNWLHPSTTSSPDDLHEPPQRVALDISRSASSGRRRQIAIGLSSSYLIATMNRWFGGTTYKRALLTHTTISSPPRMRMVWGVPGWVANSRPRAVACPGPNVLMLRIWERTCTPPKMAEASSTKDPVP